MGPRLDGEWQQRTFRLGLSAPRHEPCTQLAAIYSHVLGVEREQSDIEQTLDHIEQQQKDLSAALDAYERSVGQVLGGQGGSLRALDTGPADTERDKKYASSRMTAVFS